MKEELHARIDNDFRFHPANDNVTGQRHDKVRGLLGSTAHALVELAPEGRELSLAVTKLEEAMMWANAAIARHGE